MVTVSDFEREGFCIVKETVDEETVDYRLEDGKGNVIILSIKKFLCFSFFSKKALISQSSLSYLIEVYPIPLEFLLYSKKLFSFFISFLIFNSGCFFMSFFYCVFKCRLVNHTINHIRTRKEHTKKR